MSTEDFSKYEYVIKEPNDDIMNAVIEKSGHSSTEFTISDIENMQNQISKTLREAKAKLEIESAIVNNVEENHDYVKAMDDKVLYTVWMYWKAKEAARKCKELIEECEKGLVERHAEKEYIMNKLGFVKTAAPNPEA